MCCKNWSCLRYQHLLVSLRLSAQPRREVVTWFVGSVHAAVFRSAHGERGETCETGGTSVEHLVELYM